MRVLRSAVWMLAAVLPAFAAAGESLRIAVDPHLSVAAERHGGRVFHAAPGSAVQIRVFSVASDGSEQEVTADSATQYSVVGDDLNVSSAGFVTFYLVGDPRYAAVFIQHGDVHETVGFQIEP